MDPEDFDPKTFFSMHGSRHTSVMCLSDFLALIILDLFDIVFAKVNSKHFEACFYYVKMENILFPGKQCCIIGTLESLSWPWSAYNVTRLWS